MKRQAPCDVKILCYDLFLGDSTKYEIFLIELNFYIAALLEILLLDLFIFFALCISGP